MNPGNYCIFHILRLLGQTTKWLLSNFDTKKTWKYNPLEGWGLALVVYKKKYSCLKAKRFAFPGFFYLLLLLLLLFYDFSGISRNSEQNNFLRTIEQFMQFSCFIATKGNYSCLFLFWTNHNEEGFPRDYYLINIATYLFAYYQNRH